MSGRFNATGTSAVTRTAPKDFIAGSRPRPRPSIRAAGLRMREFEPGVRPPSAVTRSRDEAATKTLFDQIPKSVAYICGTAPGEPSRETVLTWSANRPPTPAWLVAVDPYEYPKT